MKKIFYKILLAMTAFITGIGFHFLPITASADEAGGVVETPEACDTVPDESIPPDSSAELPETDGDEEVEEIPEEGIDGENSANEGVVENDSASSSDGETSAPPDSSVEEGGGDENKDGLVPESEGSKWFDEYIMPLLVGLVAPLGGTLAGGFSLGWVLFKGVKGFKELLHAALSGLKKAKDQTDEAETSLSDAKEKMAAWQIELENAFKAWKAGLAEELKEVVSNLQAWQTAQGEQIAAREVKHRQEIQALASTQEEAIQAWQNAHAETIKQWESKFEIRIAKIFRELREEMTNKVADTNTTVHKLLNVEKIAYGDNPVLVSNGTAKKIAEVVDK